MPKCPQCGKIKPLKDFYRSEKRTTKDKRSSYCKQCTKENYRYEYSNRKGDFLEYQREYRSKNSEKFKNRVFRSQQKVRITILEHYGGSPPKCNCCGEEILDFLTLDHLKNNGNIERKEYGFGSNFWRWLIKNNYPEGYQVLCYNCNCGRARNKGICPHKEKF